MRNAKLMFAGLMGVAAAGCATLGMAKFKEPVVHFQDARITGLGVTGGSVEVKLSLYNPNGFKLDGERLTYKLMVDSVTLGTGALADRFKTTLVMFNSFYQPIKTMKVGGEVDWGRKHTTTDLEAEALRYYLVVHYDF